MNVEFPIPNEEWRSEKKEQKRRSGFWIMKAQHPFTSEEADFNK